MGGRHTAAKRGLLRGAPAETIPTAAAAATVESAAGDGSRARRRRSALDGTLAGVSLVGVPQLGGLQHGGRQRGAARQQSARALQQALRAAVLVLAALATGAPLLQAGPRGARVQLAVLLPQPLLVLLACRRRRRRRGQRL